MDCGVLLCASAPLLRGEASLWDYSFAFFAPQIICFQPLPTRFKSGQGIDNLPLAMIGILKFVHQQDGLDFLLPAGPDGRVAGQQAGGHLFQIIEV